MHRFSFLCTVWKLLPVTAVMNDRVLSGLKQHTLGIFFATSPGLWNLSSLIRDRTGGPAVRTLSPCHWTAREFLTTHTDYLAVL